MMNGTVSAVVLAGVHDWGACRLNAARLRPLAPIANRPLIEHVIRAAAWAGANKAAICVNGHVRAMRDALGDSIRGLPLCYHDDPMPRGPAGCVKDAAASCPADCLLVAEAGMVPYFDIDGMVVGHRRSGAALTIAAKRATVAEEATYAPVGMYVASATALEFIPDKGFADIKESWIPKLHRAGLRVDVHSIEGVAPRVHGVSSYFAVNEWAVELAGSGVWELDGYAVDRRTLRHIDARIDDGVQLLGPVLIGPGAVVENGAIIVGPTTIGRGCRIGEGAVVSRSAIWDEAVIGPRAQLDRCIVADGVSVERGAELFNSVCVSAGADRLGRSMDVQTADAFDEEPIEAEMELQKAWATRGSGG